MKLNELVVSWRDFQIAVLTSFSVSLLNVFTGRFNNATICVKLQLLFAKGLTILAITFVLVGFVFVSRPIMATSCWANSAHEL